MLVQSTLNLDNSVDAFRRIDAVTLVVEERSSRRINDHDIHLLRRRSSGVDDLGTSRGVDIAGQALLEELQGGVRGRAQGPYARRATSLAACADRAVRCGLCGRVAAVDYTQAGLPTFRCRHRGQGCTMPRRAATGLEKAALLGLTLLERDESLLTVIRRQLAEARAPLAQRSQRLDRSDSRSASGIERRRRKLLDLYYSDRIDPDQFAKEDSRLRAELELLQVEAVQAAADERHMDDVAKRFEDVAAVLAQMDVYRLWEAATAVERRVLVEEMLNEVVLFPDHLEVEVAGAPRLNVLLEEVGLGKPRGRPKMVPIVSVRGGT